jgi:hypothetical protein
VILNLDLMDWRRGSCSVPIIDSLADRVLGHEKYSNRLVLVDTPGFDDANKTDQVLQMINE